MKTKPMNDRSSPTIGRRDLLRVLAAGAGAVAVSTLPAKAAAAENVETAKDRKPRYRADSPEVQTFYRVNRYPAK
jgi:hypothetical protein